MNIEQYERNPYVISTDPARLDPSAVHAYLSASYWADGIPLDVVGKSLAASLCFGLYAPAGQIGLVRVITDHATFAYLCDVYVLPAHQGRGLGRWLLRCVMDSPQLQGHEQVGFRVAENPDRIMEIVRPELYRAAAVDRDRDKA